MADRVKQYYANYHDRIGDKRLESPFWIRRYAHEEIHNQFLRFMQRDQRVLDAGCGEGSLTFVLAQHGAQAVGADLSAPNVEVARRRRSGAALSLEFLRADVERLPFPDDSFDVVVSSHVLEHLPDPLPGMRELHRVTRDLALIAMPTCLTPACWALLGGDNYWKLGRRSAFAVPLGLARVVAALLGGKEGPNEGYGGDSQLPHVWRFPWVMRRQIESVGFRVEVFEPGPLVIPYLAEYLPVMRRLQVALDRRRHSSRLLRNLGYGSLAVCRKRT